MKEPRHTGTTRGFSRAGGLVQPRIRAATEGRGFGEARVLTHWAEIVGDDIAAIAHPVEISYGRGTNALGATLVVLTTGANAPMLEMQKVRICDKVNACYGYRAIARVRITQTAATGFAEGKITFGHKPKVADPTPDPVIAEQAAQTAQGVENDTLRLALETLATNVLTKLKR